MDQYEIAHGEFMETDDGDGFDPPEKKGKGEIAPPREGRWKPGQSGNPAGRPKSKPFKDALASIMNDPIMLAKTAAALVARSHNGDVGAIKEIADRLDGKVTDTLETNSLVRVVSGWDE